MAENTLGAPTEGLGQTVTFGARGAGTVPQASAGSTTGVRNELVFSGNAPVNRAVNVPEIGPDRTMAALAKMGAEIMAPKLQEAQRQRFVAGMQKAAAGQAIADIVDEQPWYAQLFNATDVVDGARAYTAFAKSNEVATSVEVNMHKLRELDGPAFAEHVQKQIESIKTGDAATDAMVFQQAMKQMPHQMAAQAKGHYVWQQERMTEAQRAAMSTALNNIAVVTAKRNISGKDASAVLGTGAEITDDLDVFSTAQAAIPAFIRPEGMDEKVHSANVAAVLSAAATQGNLPGLYAMQDAKIIDGLHEEHKVHVLNAINQAEDKAAAHYPDALVQDMADFQNMSNKAFPAADILRKRDEINSKFSQLTGSRRPLLGTATTATELAQSERTRMHQLDQLRAHEAKAAAAAEKLAVHQELITSGVAIMKTGGDPKLKPEEYKEAWATMAATQPNSIMATRVIQLNRNVDDTFKDALQTNIQTHLASGDAAAMDVVYQTQYLPLVKAAGNLKEVAGTVYAGPFAKQMYTYHQMRLTDPNNTDPSVKQLALVAALQPQNDPLSHTNADQEIRNGLTSNAVVSAAKWLWNAGPLGDHDAMPLDAAAVDAFGGAIKPFLKDVPPGAPAARIKAATVLAQQRAGLEQYGGVFWFKPTNGSSLKQGLQDTNTPHQLRVSDQELNRAFRTTIDDQLKAAGLSGTPTVMQLPDEKGLNYMVGGLTSKGELSWVRVTGDDIKKSWHAKRSEPVMKEIATIRKNIAFEQDPYYRSASSDARIKAYQKQINDKLTLIGLPAEFN